MAPQREWFEKDYYAVLGVDSGASDKDIQRAYRKLAKQYHPDANAGDADAEERFKEISAANDVLGDAERRKEYDEVRQMVASGGGHGRLRAGRLRAGLRGRHLQLRRRDGARRPVRWPLRQPRWRGPWARPRAAAAPQRGDDLESELHLDFLDAVHGVTTSVGRHVRRRVLRVQRHRRRARHGSRHLPRVRRHGRGCRRPGPVLVLGGVPAVRGARPGDRAPVQEVQGQRGRAASSRREGAHPGRRERRPAHQGEGSRRRRPQRRAARRSLRRGARAAAPDLRALRAHPPHREGADHVQRGGAGHAGEGADARRARSR